MKTRIFCLIFLVLMVTISIATSYGDQSTIPRWIKNNAKWWSEGQIGDSDFVKGIQYLLEQEIIKISQINSQSNNTAITIPTWIKNNAGWWANGSIGDDEFIKAIQYLIQVNVIKVISQHLVLSSSAFENNGTIPSEYTCDGQNISPPLTISNTPKDAKSLVLIVTDPDAPSGTFTHWTVWNIPPEKKEFVAGEKIDYQQGKTGLGKLGYVGPCPPSGTHRYVFKLYVLDSILYLSENSTRQNLEESMAGHIIERAILVGKYSKGQ